MTLVIFGVVLVVIAAIVAFFNVARTAKRGFADFNRDPFGPDLTRNFGAAFGIQAIAGVLGVVGFALLVIGIVSLVA